MREILFRGKEKDGGSFDGKWRYGDLVRVKEGSVTKTRIFEKNIGYLVVPETVGEYTGLTDKKSKKIFEGDILQDKFGQIKIVDYCNEWGAFRACFVKALNDEGKIVATVGGASFVGTIWRKYEVIGNIHDNPELLKEK